MRDIVSTTPLAEYVDMVFIRLRLAMRDYANFAWRVELRPPSQPPEFVGAPDRAGCVFFYARDTAKAHSDVHYRAQFEAVERGATPSTDVLEMVATHHVSKFIDLLEQMS